MGHKINPEGRTIVYLHDLHKWVDFKPQSVKTLNHYLNKSR